MKKMILFAMTLFIHFSAIAAEDIQTVSVVVEHWPPWEIAYDDNKEEVTGGLAVEIVQTLLDRLKLKMKLYSVPWQRALNQIKIGEFDLIPMIAKNSERETYMSFTIPIYKDPIFLFYSIDKFPIFTWDQWKDLKPFEIGIVEGFNYGMSWNKAVKEHKLIIEPVPYDRLNLRKLIKGRIDLAALYYSNSVGLFKEVPGSHKLKFSKKPITINLMRLGISKKSFLATKLPKINKILQEMNDDGTMKKILKDLLH